MWCRRLKRTTGALQAQSLFLQGRSAAELARHSNCTGANECTASSPPPRSSMNALVESLLAPAPEVDPEDATNFDDGTAARTSTGFKAGEDLAVIPKRRLVDDGEAPVGLAKSSRAELFDDGLDSGDDDVVPEDDDDIGQEPSTATTTTRATRATGGSLPSDPADERLQQDGRRRRRPTRLLLGGGPGGRRQGRGEGAREAACSALCKSTRRLGSGRLGVQGASRGGALRAAAKVEPGQCDPDAAAACRQQRGLLGAARRGVGRRRARAGHRDADALWEDSDVLHRQKRPQWEAAAGTATRTVRAQPSMGECQADERRAAFEQARLAATHPSRRARKSRCTRRHARAGSRAAVRRGVPRPRVLNIGGGLRRCRAVPERYSSLQRPAAQCRCSIRCSSAACLAFRRPRPAATSTHDIHTFVSPLCFSARAAGVTLIPGGDGHQAAQP